MVPESSAGGRRAPTVVSADEPAWVARLRRAARLDLAPAHRQPSTPLVVVATLAALVASIGVDELAVHVATSMFPTTRHFSHFRFADYATLTVVGVLLACVAWPAVTRLSSAPRWLFFRLAVVAMLALWIPDGWLLLRGETAKGVAVLMVMHLLIALVTYNLLVHVAGIGGPSGAGPSVARTGGPPAPLQLSELAVRQIWNTMAALVAAEFALGVATIVSVPFRRPDAVLPHRATWLYAAHGAVGISLGVGALLVLGLSAAAGRMARIGAVMGAVGMLLGLAGGVLATFQATRLLGMGVMLVGTVIAGIGYLVPSLEALGKAEAARAEAARAELSVARGAPADAVLATSDVGDEPSVNGHGAEPSAE